MSSSLPIPAFLLYPLIDHSLLRLTLLFLSLPCLSLFFSSYYSLSILFLSLLIVFYLFCLHLSLTASTLTLLFWDDIISLLISTLLFPTSQILLSPSYLCGSLTSVYHTAIKILHKTGRRTVILFLKLLSFFLSVASAVCLPIYSTSATTCF